MGYFTRLTFNSNHWQNPSGPEGKCPGLPGAPLWECSAGFGFEEWYRSENFRRTENGDVWQYGYWQCFKNPGNHAAGVYADFNVYTRKCIGGCDGANMGTSLHVARYTEITVLSMNERLEAINYFDAALQDIRGNLEQLGLDVHDTFVGQPNGYPQLNIKFRISDETYVFDGVRPFTPERGGYRFGLYLRH
jgi:hypothetical protein